MWNQLQSANTLAKACDFACHRKELSSALSILILRFFHGYYPGEICVLLGAPRKVVYRWIERGRIEAKEYMEAPYPLTESLMAARGSTIRSECVLGRGPRSETSTMLQT